MVAQTADTPHSAKAELIRADENGADDDALFSQNTPMLLQQLSSLLERLGIEGNHATATCFIRSCVQYRFDNRLAIIPNGIWTEDYSPPMFLFAFLRARI